MEGRIWGYCRVSTAMQCEDRQLRALREYGVEEKRIVQDKKSGKNFDRPGYQRMLRALRRGDTVVFPSVAGRGLKSSVNYECTYSGDGERKI